MKFELKNIGYLKEASVCLDGLTVIGGENDTGKSTVGKALMALIKADNMAKKTERNFSENRQKAFSRQTTLLFERQIKHFKTSKSFLSLSDDSNSIYHCSIENRSSINKKNSPHKKRKFYKTVFLYHKEKSLSQEDHRPFLDCTFIQTPLVWDLYDFFTSINVSKIQTDIEDMNKFNPKYPYILWDTYAKLVNSRESNKNLGMINQVKKIMSGSFVKGDLGKYYFSKMNPKGMEEKINLINVATGIKYFGLLQVLLEHCYINEKCFLIFDEPENHLHPKWQLKFAEVICQFVKIGIKILINSHSPYMIEALEKYSQKHKIPTKTNFYLAENHIIEPKNKLENIYDKLATPFETFEKIDSEILK